MTLFPRNSREIYVFPRPKMENGMEKVQLSTLLITHRDKLKQLTIEQCLSAHIWRMSAVWNDDQLTTGTDLTGISASLICMSRSCSPQTAKTGAVILWICSRCGPIPTGGTAT